MKLISLHAKNVFSIGEIEINLSNRGLTLITGYNADDNGSNGAGKSSLANKAILWGLFGSTAGGLGADAVLNRHGKRQGSVRVEFEGVDGVRYMVVRERPAKLILERQGEDVSATTAKDTQVMIDRALGIDFKTFIQTSFFGQGRNLSYASLAPKEQKAVLEQILPMEEVDRWATYADAQYKEVDKKVKEIESDLGRDQATLEAHKGQYEYTISQSKKWKHDQTTKILSIEEEILNINDKFSNEYNRLSILNQYMNTIDEVDVGVEIDTITTNQRTHTIRVNEVENRCREAYDSLFKWQIRQKYLDNEIESLEGSKSCPTCLRPYDEHQEVEDRINKTKALIIEARDNIMLANQAHRHYESELQSIREEGAKFFDKVGELKNKLHMKTQYNAEAESITTRIGNVKKTLEKDKEKIKDASNPYDTTITDLGMKIEMLDKKILKKNERLGKLLREYEHLDYWRNVYSKELKLKLFEDACPFLDERTTYHLERLKNAQIHVEFSTVKRLATGKPKEEFNVNVWSETGGSGFDSLSGGEQQMVSFAIGLGLSDLARAISSVYSSFIILDEPFSELDARNSESIVEYLTGEMSAGKETMFLISNEETLKGLIPNRINVVKQHGITTIKNN